MIRTLAFICIVLMSTAATATEAGWALLRDGGHVVLLRHAYATSAGDPANVDPVDCATQRPLSERGRQQARKIGALFAARADATDKVLWSRYCRTADTAQLAFGRATGEGVAILDPIAGDDAAEAGQLAAIVAEVGNWNGSGNLVLVTHGDVIQALTGMVPREGEALIVRADGERLHVLARIVF